MNLIEKKKLIKIIIMNLIEKRKKYLIEPWSLSQRPRRLRKEERFSF